MPRAIMVVPVLLLLAAACSSDTATTTVPAESGSGHPLVIQSVDFEGGIIEIRNSGSSDYDLTGHFLCNRPNYQAVPAEVLGPGETLQVPMAGLRIAADSGEIGLYTRRAFDSSEAMARYVEWGASGHGRSATAIAAEVWREGDFVDNAGANIVSSGDDPVSEADWSNG